MNSELQRRVEEFLYHEACLMDDNRYQDWLALFDRDCVYWIPSNKADYDPAKHVSILYGGYSMLQNHVHRLTEGKAFAQAPQSRLCRVISNIQFDPEDPMKVRAKFVVVELRNRTQRVHAGSSEYQLCESDRILKIKKKKVLLLGMDEHQENVTFLL